MGYSLNGFHTLPKALNGLTILLKRPVRQIPDFQIGNPAESRSPQLFPHIGFPLIRRNKEQSLQGLRL